MHLIEVGDEPHRLTDLARCGGIDPRADFDAINDEIDHRLHAHRLDDIELYVEHRRSRRDLAALLDETLGSDTGFDGSVVTGRIVRLTDEFAIVDVGLKSEGRVALKEFGPPGGKPEIKPGGSY